MNASVQIKVKVGAVQFSKPYITPNDISRVRISPHEEGYIITNAHVVGTPSTSRTPDPSDAVPTNTIGVSRQGYSVAPD